MTISTLSIPGDWFCLLSYKNTEDFIPCSTSIITIKLPLYLEPYLKNKMPLLTELSLAHQLLFSDMEDFIFHGMLTSCHQFCPLARVHPHEAHGVLFNQGCLWHNLSDLLTSCS